MKPLTIKKNTTNNRYEATGKAVNVTVVAKAAPKAVVKPLATLDFTTSGNKASLDNGKRKDKYVVANSVALGIPDPNPEAVTGKVFEALNNANIKGTLNHFAKYFKLNDGDVKTQFIFQCSAAYTDVNGKTVQAVDKLDPKLDKNELQGWIAYKYQSLDGEVHYEYYKVTLKTGKNGISK